MDKFHWSEIVLAAVSALTAAFGGWWAMLGKKQQTSAKQQVEFYAQVISEVQQLRAQNLELQLQVSKLQEEVHLLRNKIYDYEVNPAYIQSKQLLRAVLNSFRNPTWIHDLSNNKWYLNDAYCARFHVQREDFWTPVNILGRYSSEEALAYAENDIAVIKTGVPIEFSEKARVRILDPKCQEFIHGQFRKTPIVISDHPYVLGEMLSTREDPLVDLTPGK